VELHMSYTHLSQDERYQIQHLHGGGFSTREIGIQLERAATTIGRELLRNPSNAGRYQARVAQRKSVKRRHVASAQARILPAQWAAVEARLTTEQWSPVQIASESSISHERIYQHIAADRICAVASVVVAIVAARHDSDSAFMDDASPSDRPSWRAASVWATGKATPS
jgi:IS30 family transposase